MLWAVLVLLLVGSHFSTQACTGFVAVKNGNVLAGQNVDWKNPHRYCWFQPAVKGKYGCLFFGQLPGWMSGAVNHQGLYVVGAAIPSTKLKKNAGTYNGAHNGLL